jgi:hypothetical protein
VVQGKLASEAHSALTHKQRRADHRAHLAACWLVGGHLRPRCSRCDTRDLKDFNVAVHIAWNCGAITSDAKTVGDTKGTSRPDPQREQRSPMSLPFVFQDRCARLQSRNRRFAVDFSSARSRRWKADSLQGAMQRIRTRRFGKKVTSPGLPRRCGSPVMRWSRASA